MEKNAVKNGKNFEKNGVKKTWKIGGKRSKETGTHENIKGSKRWAETAKTYEVCREMHGTHAYA